jgi:hypothetical protein
MINHESANIDGIAIHKVGNKSLDEGVKISKAALHPNEAINQLLLTYFFTPFKLNEYYNLYHETDLKLNEVYNYVNAIFDDPGQLYEQSVNMARHLYNQSVHPKIKSGELYVTYLQDCVIDGETVDAVGIFKSETRETYLKIFSNDNGFEIRSDEGISLSKLDKGCIIFNLESASGYVVALADNLKKSNEARYWNGDFLRLIERTDSFYHTRNAMEMCRAFVTEKLPEDFEATKVDQADMLNKTAKFFKENDSFSMGEFAQEVIQQPAVIDSFNAYKKIFENDRQIPIADEFEISENAVKKQSRVFKSVIKLDKNFHIYVHGKREYITKGFDEASGMNFYQLYFKEER